MTAEELLAAMTEPLAEDGTYCTIDPETRVITIPPEYQLLGVESDEKAERLYFKCPKIVGDNIDLTKLALRVNFRNAGAVVDQYLVDDVEVDGDDITFSWLLSRRVTQYEGTVSFIVCAVKVSGEEITNEWNTTLAEAEVLEGLEVEVTLPEDETDIVNQLLSLAETRLNDVKEATADANTAASNANQKAQEAENAAEDARGVTDQITKDSYLHTALQSFIDTVTATPTAYGNAIAKKIEGFTRQETTTGAQLFDMSAAMVVGSATYKIIDDFTIEITGGRSETNVYSNVNFSMSKIKNLIQGKKIYIYIEFTGSHRPLGQLTIVPKTGDNIYKPFQSKQWAEVDVPSDCTSITFQLYPTTETGTTDTVTFSNIKIGLSQFDTQEPYTGGQPAPNPDYPMEVQGTGYSGFFDGELLQGYYKTADGILSTGMDYVCNKNMIPCKPGDNIALDISINSSAVFLLYYDTNGKYVSHKALNAGSHFKTTVPASIYGFNFDIQKSGGLTPDTVGPITITINGKYALCVKSTGKNLLDFKTFLDSRGSQYTKSGDRYRITGIGTAFSQQIFLSDEDENFTLSGSVTSESGSGYSVQLLNKAGSTVATLRNEVTNVSGKGCKLRLNYSEAGAGIYENIMVEKGASHEQYIPYQSNVTYIPVDYPLFEGDKIVQRNGEYKLVRKWGFKTYDGSDDENWNIIYNEENNVYNIYIADMMNDGKRGMLVPNNYFYNSEYDYALHSSYISSSGNYNIMISPDMNIDAVQEWKDWLKTHTMYCAYELAAPTEEPLSPEAQKALHSIMATDEQTELTIVGVPADAEISNQFLLPRNEDGALNTTAYCTAEKNKIVLNELVAQNLDARVNKLEIDNAALAEQTIVVE